MMGSSMGMVSKDKDGMTANGMAKSAHTDGTMMGNEKHGMMADGMMKTSHEKRAMMGKEGMNVGDMGTATQMGTHERAIAHDDHDTGMGIGMAHDMSTAHPIE